MGGEPEGRRFDAGLVLAPLLAALILSPSLLYPFGRDQGVFAYVGSILLRGGLPYRDVWEIKAPPIYLTYAAILRLGGPPEFVVHLVDVLIAAAAALGLYLLGRAAAGRAAGLAAAGWFAALYLRGGFWSLAQAESFGSAALVAAAIAGWAAQHRGGDPAAPRSLSPTLLLATGVAAGIGAAYKVTLALTGLLILGWAVFPLLWWRSGPGGGPRSSGRGWLVGLIAGVLGFALPLGAMFGWMAVTGCLPDYVEIQREFIPLYSALQPAGWNAGLATGTADYFRGTLVPLGLAALSLLPAAWQLRPASASAADRPPGSHDARPLRLLAVGWLLLAYVGVVAQRKYFGYHWTPMLPPLALLAGLGTDAFVQVVVRRAGGGSGGAAPRALLAVALVIGWALSSRGGRFMDAARVVTGRMSRSAYLATFNPPWKGDFSPLADQWAADAVRARTQPEEAIFIWGFEPLVYFLADRRPPTRFAFSEAQVIPGAPRTWRDELLRDLRRRPPVLFLVVRQDSVPWASGTPLDSAGTLEEFPDLRAFLDRHYEPVGFVEHFTFYRLRPTRNPAHTAGPGPAAGGTGAGDG